MPILVLFLSIFGAFMGAKVLRRFWEDVDPAAAHGIAGILSLGVLGTLIGLIGMVDTVAGILIGCLLWFAILAIAPRSNLAMRLGTLTREDWFFLVPIGLAVGLATLGACSPSTPLDWDSLAYHLAVPKLWLSLGKVQSIPYIHHSNFPGAVDSLFLLGLWQHSETAAKIVMPFFMACGCLTAFGLGRAHYGRQAGWWAALVFATCPLVIWESGTAYIDVPNGLFAGIGIYALSQLLRDGRKHWFFLIGLGLGLCAGSKYTGLLIIAIAFAIAALHSRKPEVLKSLALAGVVIAIVAGPWYARNIAWKGNPVFPFFYSKLGGTGWDQRRAEIYANEQRTFGIGRVAVDGKEASNSPLDLKRVAHSVFGLAYVPGKFVNPQQSTGGGVPIGAFGVALILGGFAWLLAGRKASEDGENYLVDAVLLTLLAWFFLTQQVRYILVLALPLSLLTAAVISRLKWGMAMRLVVALQAAFSLFLVYQLLGIGQLRHAILASSEAPSVPDWAVSIGNEHPGRVALYDEVFGYYLDVPYIWANPGHSTLLDYDHMSTGEDLVAGLKQLGVTHVYHNFARLVSPPEDQAGWLTSAGIVPAAPPEQVLQWHDARVNSFEQKYKVLTADATRKGLLEQVASGKNYRWLLLKVR